MEINALARRVGDSVLRGSARRGGIGHGLDSPTLWEERTERNKKQIEELKQMVMDVKASSDGTAITFGSLSFKSDQECNAWIKTHFPRDDFGYIIDFHVLMEHLQNQMCGDGELLKRLERVYKLKLATLMQGNTITSFESKIPKFFSNTIGHSVVRRDQSYFPTLKNFSDWDLPYDGFRQRLLDEMEDFRVSHAEAIERNLEPLSPVYSIAVLSLQTLCSFLIALVAFIDETYKEYVRAKYGSGVAWHVTTLLATRVIKMITGPRVGVETTFQMGDINAIKRVSIYATLKSLDLMTSLQRIGFRNSPDILSELVRFLAVNSEYQSVQDLQEQVKTLIEGSRDLKKEAAAAAKGAATAANKVDQLKEQVTSLAKRLKALEDLR